jgi:hypothetical protein
MVQPGSVRADRVEVSEETDALARASYASAFEVSGARLDARSAEQWARAAFEDAPAVLRSSVLIGWRYVLGLRLGPRRAPAHVLGWAIVRKATDSIVLEARSPLLTARKIVRIESSRVVMTTFVRYERRAGGVVWAAVAPVHHRTEPWLLAHAASRAPRSPALEALGTDHLQ